MIKNLRTNDVGILHVHSRTWRSKLYRLTENIPRQKPTMTVGPLEVWLCVAIAVVINQCSGVTVPCLSCSYTFAGDGTTDHECVTDVLNHTRTQVINCTRGRCYTKAVYTQEYHTLTSLSRGCSFDKSDSEDCDLPHTLIPTCLMVCSSSQCNSQRGDIWISKHYNGDASSVRYTHYLIFVSFLFLALQTYD